MPLQIHVPMEKTGAFCRTWKVQQMRLFGSVLRDDFGPESDVDVLIEFAPEARWNLLDLIDAERDLSEISGCSVDLIERQWVDQSDDWIHRRHILEHARTFSVAR